MMSDTLTRPERKTIFDLSPEDRAAEYEAGHERVREASREMVREIKARKPDPRGDALYRAWHKIAVCILVVKHRDRANSIECSRDGGGGSRIFLPTRMIEIQPESAGEFVLAVIPKWLATKAELNGVSPELTSERAWTSADVSAWEALRKLRFSINTRIHFPKKRTSSNISRSNAA